jgi:hypothetical protein
MILQSLKPRIFKRLEKFRARWVGELPSVLWGCVPHRVVPQASHPSSWCMARKQSCPRTSTTAVREYRPTPKKATKLR